MSGEFRKVKDISLFEGDVVRINGRLLKFYQLMYPSTTRSVMVIFQDAFAASDYTPYSAETEVYFEGYVDRPLAKEMWDKYHINITDSRGVFWNYPGEGKVAFDSCDRLAEEIAEWRDTN